LCLQHRIIKYTIPVIVCPVLVCLGDDVLKVRCQDNGHPLSLHAKLGLEVTQEMAKINVKQLKNAGLIDVKEVESKYLAGITVKKTLLKML